MSIERLRVRVPSAEFISVVTLLGYALKFHKRSKRDVSGKCDAAFTGSDEDKVYGALYSIQTSQFPDLDKFEGRGHGYERKTVIVNALSGEAFEAETYVATILDANIRPLDWYKEHVLRGARSIGLPSAYIASIEAVVADVDTDVHRRAKELSIYD